MNTDDFKEILYQKESNGIVTVTLNVPKRKNALASTRPTSCSRPLTLWKRTRWLT